MDTKRCCRDMVLCQFELAQTYPLHHVLLITSSWETGPIVAWEAMAAGMAVVVAAMWGLVLKKP